MARPPVDLARVEDLTRQLLLALGEDPSREGLQHTPRRVARWWAEFLGYDRGALATFAVPNEQARDVVTVRGIKVWSLCEHHLLPFWAEVTIAYRPTSGRVLGLSKFARIAQAHAHRLQLQERLVAGIAEDVAAAAGTQDVAVHARGEHLCMVMRGVRTPGLMETVALRGEFHTNEALAGRFLGGVR